MVMRDGKYSGSFKLAHLDGVSTIGAAAAPRPWRTNATATTIENALRNMMVD